jgi:hypothetical protein
VIQTTENAFSKASKRLYRSQESVYFDTERFCPVVEPDRLYDGLHKDFTTDFTTATSGAAMTKETRWP